ncbi:MAG: hypothetical protein EOS36_05420 [Mesorhizobium sp.]|nr:MAG: hypothetical protein EOS36_05420 [Mesorhizobium sp.]RWE51596.1 MAG: hypothetical protein EOS79_01240 [Mesorhizobium sp.]
MSPKSAQRFWENDMHQNRDLKRVARRDALWSGCARTERDSITKGKQSCLAIWLNVHFPTGSTCR